MPDCRISPKWWLSLWLLVGLAWSSSAAAWYPQAPEISRSCEYGDCLDGYGILVIRNDFGTDRYEGDFRDGEFHGFGRLEFMASRSERGYYEGSWNMGVREGRGTYWDGKSQLYIGEWSDDRRHGYGSYFFGVTDWSPNRYTEFWLREHVE